MSIYILKPSTPRLKIRSKNILQASFLPHAGAEPAAALCRAGVCIGWFVVHGARQCSKVELQTHAMPPNRCETDEIRLQGSLNILNGRLAEVRKDMKAKKKHSEDSTHERETTHHAGSSSNHLLAARWS